MRPTVYTSRSRDSYPARLLRALYSAIIPGVGQLRSGRSASRSHPPRDLRGRHPRRHRRALTRGFDAIVTWAVQPKSPAHAPLDRHHHHAHPDVRGHRRVDDGQGAAPSNRSRPSGPRHPPDRAWAWCSSWPSPSCRTRWPGTTPSSPTTCSPRSSPTATATTTTTQKIETAPSGGTGSNTTGGSDDDAAPARPPRRRPSNWGSDGRMTILLIGTDAGYGRTRRPVGLHERRDPRHQDRQGGHVRPAAQHRQHAAGAEDRQGPRQKTYPDMLNSLYTAGLAHPEIAPRMAETRAPRRSWRRPGSSWASRSTTTRWST